MHDALKETTGRGKTKRPQRKQEELTEEDQEVRTTVVEKRKIKMEEEKSVKV